MKRPAKPVAVASTSKPTNPKDAVGIRKVPLSTLPATVLLDVAFCLGNGISAIPIRPMLEAGLGMMEGARKYGRHNYRRTGVRASVYYDATLRHCVQWYSGEDTDPDSGLSHVGKAICSAVVLRDAMIQDKLTDDRPPPGAAHFDGMSQGTACLELGGPSVRATHAYSGIVTDLMQWWEGVDMCPDMPGVHLVVRVLARLFVLRQAIYTGKLEDDRPRDELPAGWIGGFNVAAGTLIEKYPEEQPAITRLP